MPDPSFGLEIPDFELEIPDFDVIFRHFPQKTTHFHPGNRQKIDEIDPFHTLQNGVAHFRCHRARGPLLPGGPEMALLHPEKGAKITKNGDFLVIF